MLAAALVRADETFPVLKVGNQIYTNATVTTITPTDIYFTHSKGMGNAKLKDLEPPMQDHFNYHPAGEKKQPGVSDSETKAMLEDAMAQVRKIVNQPVTGIHRTPDMDVAMYPSWFHPGAEQPDFNVVDVRATQHFDYDQFQYVASEQNPNVVFRGRELEFNPMTKYFYTDRSVPKKKLSEADMLELNRLYRIIGTCQAKLAASQANEPAVKRKMDAALAYVTLHKQGTIVTIFALALLLALVRLSKRQVA